jgi:hypothetical protein
MAKNHCKENDGVLAVALTPRVQRHVYRLAEMDVKSDRFCDTSFSEGSLHAATRSAGAVCHAIDKVGQVVEVSLALLVACWFGLVGFVWLGLA